MAIRRYNTEQIISKIREVEVHVRNGMRVSEAVRQIGVTDATYYKWRKKYGGLELNQAKKFKDLERENTRLKKLVADLSLDNAILKEVSSGNF